MRERRKQYQTPREVFDYIQEILKADEPDVVERPAVPVTTKEVVPAPRVAAPKKHKAKPKPKPDRMLPGKRPVTKRNRRKRPAHELRH